MTFKQLKMHRSFLIHPGQSPDIHGRLRKITEFAAELDGSKDVVRIEPDTLVTEVAGKDDELEYPASR